ncbi:MAG TPA: hypothetical protein VHG93_25710 [Longimicrobium sp.]|nr:hypothetical protein [Longimicrobium sp.]
MKRMLLMLLVVAATAGCGGGEGEVPSDRPGQDATADSAQKDNTGPGGARTGG